MRFWPRGALAASRQTGPGWLGGNRPAGPRHAVLGLGGLQVPGPGRRNLGEARKVELALLPKPTLGQEVKAASLANLKRGDPHGANLPHREEGGAVRDQWPPPPGPALAKRTR